MTQSTQIVDARILRADGKVDGLRPEVKISHSPLKIKPPSIDVAPKPPLDVILIFGMGPISPRLVLGYLNHRLIGQSRMKQNAIAALELSARGFVHEKGLIIPSGTATADPALVEAASKLKQNNSKDWDALMARLELKSTNKPLNEKKQEQQTPSSIEDKPTDRTTEKFYTTSEAQLMEWLFLKGHAKVMRQDGKARVTGQSTHLEIFLENLATETEENFIFTINELDKRSRRKNKTLFKGSIGAVTSRYHVARTMEIARYLGLENQVVPLVSQEVLKHFGYDPNLFKGGKYFDLATRWNEQKWTRTLHQIPENLLPVLPKIQDDERLINCLIHLKSIYGDEVFKKISLENITIQNVEKVRSKLLAINRLNPKVEEWMKEDVKEINEAIDKYVIFTNDWINVNSPLTNRII